MKWSPVESCQPGDVVRVKVGLLYHLGIFVSENQVVQFGQRPDRHVPKEDVRVCVTTMDEFCNGDVFEAGHFVRGEKPFAPQQIVQNALQSIGESGYDIIHNNCEHFVNRCVFGKSTSQQVNQVRAVWQARPLFKIYLSPVRDCTETVFPPKRQKEIDSVNNPQLKAEKFSTWKLLEYVLLREFGVKLEKLHFKKSKFGKWSCEVCNFSISHSHNCVCVAVSNKSIGVDLEETELFSQRFADEGRRKAFWNNIVSASEKQLPQDVETLLKMWTGKECVFKCHGKGNFCPSQTESLSAHHATFTLLEKNWHLAYCGENANCAELYFWDGSTKKIDLQKI